MRIPFIDVVVLVGYLLFTMALGLWISRRAGHDRENYFLAGHSLTWPFIGASIFGANISSMQLVGQAGLAYSVGLAAGNPQLVGGIGLVLLALFFVPVYLRRRIVTVPEFLEGRYGPESRLLLSVISIFSFVIIRISITLYAGGS